MSLAPTLKLEPKIPPLPMKVVDGLFVISVCCAIAIEPHALAQASAVAAASFRVVAVFIFLSSLGSKCRDRVAGVRTRSASGRLTAESARSAHDEMSGTENSSKALGRPRVSPQRAGLTC